AYPVAGGEQIKAFMEYDPENGRPLRGGHEAYDAVVSTASIRPQLLRVRLGRPIPVTPGVLLVLRHEVFGHNAFDCIDCSGVQVEKVTSYTCPGMGLWALHCENLRIRQCRVMIRPGSGRLMSTTADATHFNTCKGTVEVSDCLFEGMGDDALNAHGRY